MQSDTISLKTEFKNFKHSFLKLANNFKLHSSHKSQNPSGFYFGISRGLFVGSSRCFTSWMCSRLL